MLYFVLKHCQITTFEVFFPFALIVLAGRSKKQTFKRMYRGLFLLRSDYDPDRRLILTLGEIDNALRFKKSFSIGFLIDEFQLTYLEHTCS